MSEPLQKDIPIGIIGAGGLGKEVLCCCGDILGWDHVKAGMKFLVEDAYYKKVEVFGVEVLRLEIATSDYASYIMAIGDAKARERLRSVFPKKTKFSQIIHPSVSMTPYTHLGPGSIVLGNVLLSCDVRIGAFAVINPGTTISHDTKIGDYFSASPGVNISGNCTIGNRVFMGTNSCTRNGVSIGDDIIVGMGAVVVKDINEPGTYIGNPAVRVK